MKLRSSHCLPTNASVCVACLLLRSSYNPQKYLHFWLSGLEDRMNTLGRSVESFARVYLSSNYSGHSILNTCRIVI